MRLGDYIDDHCSRCKRTTDHAVVSMVGEEVKKVRCRTCNHEHNYKPERRAKQPMTKEEAFQKVLASVVGAQTGAAEPEKKKKKA
jgi:recombinational DNA repair protein (RecF pathway)